MSEIKVNSIKGVGASVAALSINNSDGTCTANITNKPNRNLIINGACLIAQRGLSSTTQSGYGTVDRMSVYQANTGANITSSQVDVASGTPAYQSGFRKAIQITKGSGTAATNSQINLSYQIEAQDIANSGWDYTNPNSFLTFSFWVKTSVANHNPQVAFVDMDSSQNGSKNYQFEVPTLTANTWTKITHSIPGHADQVYDNNNAVGIHFYIFPWLGTDFTDNSNTMNAWSSFGTKDINTTWLTTNNSTFQVTGMQLEVSDHATSFEFLSFSDELRRCMRYFVKYIADNGSGAYNGYGTGYYGSNTATINIPYLSVLRSQPSITLSGTNRVIPSGSGNPTINSHYMGTRNGYLNLSNLSGTASGAAAMFTADNDSTAFMSLDAEL